MCQQLLRVYNYVSTTILSAAPPRRPLAPTRSPDGSPHHHPTPFSPPPIPPSPQSSLSVLSLPPPPLLSPRQLRSGLRDAAGDALPLLRRQGRRPRRHLPRPVPRGPPPPPAALRRHLPPPVPSAPPRPVPPPLLARPEPPARASAAPPPAPAAGPPKLGELAEAAARICVCVCVCARARVRIHAYACGGACVRAGVRACVSG